MRIDLATKIRAKSLIFQPLLMAVSLLLVGCPPRPHRVTLLLHRPFQLKAPMCTQLLGWSGNPPAKPGSSEVEFSRYEGILHEEVTIHRQPDHGGAQAG